MLRELAGSQDPAPQLAGQLFNSRGEIDGRTDTGEVKAIPAADIAVEDIANVQGQAEHLELVVTADQVAAARPGTVAVRCESSLRCSVVAGPLCPATRRAASVPDFD